MATPNIERNTDTTSDDVIIGPDIEVVPDVTAETEVEIGPDLALRLGSERTTETYNQIEALREEPTKTPLKARIADRFGPEMAAAVGITALATIFIVLILLGVNEQPLPVDSIEANTPAVAPPAEGADDVPDVEIGEGVTLERD